MPGYTVILDKRAVKDYEELRRQGYGDKVDGILGQLQTDPFEPPYEKLCGEYRGFYSRRVNRTDRIVYEMREGACDDGSDAVVVSRMRARYRGMLSMLMLRDGLPCRGGGRISRHTGGRPAGSASETHPRSSGCGGILPLFRHLYDGSSPGTAGAAWTPSCGRGPWRCRPYENGEPSPVKMRNGFSGKWGTRIQENEEPFHVKMRNPTVTADR